MDAESSLNLNGNQTAVAAGTYLYLPSTYNARAEGLSLGLYRGLS